MRVALVHDDLVQWGGAERILFGLSEIFPDAPIYTSVFDVKNDILSKKFGSKKVVTSFMQKFPFWKSGYKALLPFYPIAFEQFDFSDFDLVISHTTRFAKSILTKPNTNHICYCHTPPRFLWNYSGIKESPFLSPFFSKLRILDQISSNRIDTFLAGSKNAKERIRKVYKKDSQILYPFVDEDFFQSRLGFKGDYYLVISRLNEYKRVNLVVEVFNELGINLKIVGMGPEYENLVRLSKSNIEILGKVSNDLLVDLIAGCRALIVAGEEDFGLVSLEAQAMGKPVIAFRSPGLEESVIENVTGIFFENQNVSEIRNAVVKMEKIKFKVQDCVENASRFKFENFKKNLLSKLNS